MGNTPRCLKDLGIEKERWMSEDVNRDDEVRQVFTYGFDERDVWDIAYSSARWLYLHIKMYKDMTISFDNMDFDVEDIDGQKHIYTKNDCMNKILEYLGEYIKYSNVDSVVEKYSDIDEEILKKKLSVAFGIYSNIVNYLWW